MLQNSSFKQFNKYLLIPLCSILFSCGMFSPIEQQQTHSYQITSRIDISKISCNKNNLTILQITQMQADEPFNTNKMIYTSSKYELATYSYNKWATSPQQMLTIAIQEKLLQSCLYSNIVTEEVVTSSQYRLATQLLTLKQIINGTKSHVDLSILAQLIDNNSNHIIKSKTFSASIEASANPKSYVEATNQATQTILDSLVTWLH